MSSSEENRPTGPFVLLILSILVPKEQENTVLDNLLDRIWTELEAAVAPRMAFNFLQVATRGLNGDPSLRTVVLRDADRKSRTIKFTTDFRSRKRTEIERSPDLALCAYDPNGLVQLRAKGKANVYHDTAETREMWNALRATSLVNFQQLQASGCVLAHPNDLNFETADGSSIGGYENFCVVTVRLHELDWLDLSGQPHRRSVFEWTGGNWIGNWLAP